MSVRVGKRLLIGTALALTGCSSTPPPEMAAAPFEPAPPPPPQAWSRPIAPRGVAANFAIPARASDGRYMTPNYALSDADTLWHVRMALNVAALSCRDDPAEPARINYIRLLSAHRATLDQANRTVDAQYRANFGGKAVAMRDTHNTKAYNFFALPAVQRDFCEAAVQVSGTAATMSSAQLAGYAPAALAQLERPFADFFNAYAAYQEDLARWQGGQIAALRPAAPERVAVATVAAPAPMASVTPAPIRVAAAAPAPAPALLREGGYVVQLSAFSEGDAAQTIWSDLAARHRAIARLPVVQSEAKVSGVTMHRLAVAGFATQAEASKTCAALKADGGSCFVRARLAGEAPARWASAAT